MALLDYRTRRCTALDGTVFKEQLPDPRSLLAPACYSQNIKQCMGIEKAKPKFNHEKQTTLEYSALHPVDQVCMAPLPGTREWTPAVVVDHLGSPRPTRTVYMECVST